MNRGLIGILRPIRGRKEEEGVEKCITRSSVTCTLHQVIVVVNNKSVLLFCLMHLISFTGDFKTGI